MLNLLCEVNKHVHSKQFNAGYFIIEYKLQKCLSFVCTLVWWKTTSSVHFWPFKLTWKWGWVTQECTVLVLIMILSEWVVWFMMFNATFINISVVSWQSVLLVVETRENHRPVVSHWQTLSHNIVLSTSLHERGSNSQF